MVDDDFIYQNMRSTEYDADTFLGGNKLWCHTFRHQNLHLRYTTVTTLEHNCQIFGTQLSHN